MFGWWLELPWYARYAVAAIPLAVSTIFLLYGVFWPWGWAVGIILLLFGGPSRSEKNGYHF